MMDDNNIKAIFCARGGYGMGRIIDKLNFKKFKKNPKWIIGFSDITVLQATFFQIIKLLLFMRQWLQHLMMENLIINIFKACMML